ncbi:MAG: UrcA family protein [Pseudomonadota bacterium]
MLKLALAPVAVAAVTALTGDPGSTPEGFTFRADAQAMASSEGWQATMDKLSEEARAYCADAQASPASRSTAQSCADDLIQSVTTALSHRAFHNQLARVRS